MIQNEWGTKVSNVEITAIDLFRKYIYNVSTQVNEFYIA